MTGPDRNDTPPTGWTPQRVDDDFAKEDIVIDHPLYRQAPTISVAVGAAAALAVLLFAETPWWMPFLVFLVVGSVLFRFLRPRLRHPSIEDEL